MDTDIYIVGILWWLTIPAYLVVQIIALLRSSGFGRVAAALPLVVMVPIFILSAIDLAHDSNLCFLGLYFTCPLALVYVVVVAVLTGGKQAHSPRPAGR